MSLTSLKKISLISILAVLSSPVFAVLPASGLATTDFNSNNSQSTQALNTRILASLVSTNAQGQETLSPIPEQTQLASGSVIEYQGHIVNTSTERLRKVTVTLNIPANTELLNIENLSPNRAKGSVDGVNFQYMPLKTNVNGVMQSLPTSYYKALQWDIEGLGLDEVATVKYRVKVK